MLRHFDPATVAATDPAAHDRGLAFFDGPDAITVELAAWS